jgi:hypothetical protein
VVQVHQQQSKGYMKEGEEEDEEEEEELGF